MPLVANSLRTLSAALVSAALVIATLVLGRDVLVPLALAGISCFILVPPVRWLKRLCVPDGLAATLVVLAVTGMLVAASIGLSSQLLSLAADLPAYRANVLDKVHNLVGSSMPSGLVGRAIDAVESYRQMLDKELKLGSDSPPPPILTSPEAGAKPEQKVVIVDNNNEGPAMRGLRILAEPLAQAALTFLFTLFLLMQHEDLRDRVVRVFGTENMSETTAAMSDAGDRLIDLFTGQVMLNASFGLVVGCVLAIVGVPNAPLWGVVAFVMRFVPFVGSYIAAVPPILLAAAVDPDWTKAISTAALFLIGEPIMGQVIEPFFLGKRAGLSPFAMVLATSFWTLAWGPIGLVLAAPLTLILVVLGRYITNLEFVSVLLGDEPPLSPQQDFYHRLLSGDAYAALAQMEEAEETSSPEAVLDGIVFPALALAVRDHRRGRFDAESLEELDETITEMIERSGRCGTPDGARIYFVPARGSFDTLASRLAAGAMNIPAPGSAGTVEEVSGLTALGSIEEQDLDIEQLVLITVTGISDKLVRFLVKRAKERFPNARLVFVDLTRPAGSIQEGSLEKGGVDTFSRLADFAATTLPTQGKSGAPKAVKAGLGFAPELKIQGSHNG